jgi:hypothetical protein
LAWQQMLPPPGAYADYQFFDTQDSSGNARHGTLIGAAALGGGQPVSGRQHGDDGG